jgi:hypothetical protein
MPIRRVRARSGGSVSRYLESSSSDVGFCRKQSQFSFRHRKPRSATSQAKHQLGKYEDRGLINIFKSGDVDGDLSSETA